MYVINQILKTNFMKKKVFLTAALLCAFSLASFAQLTTGEPSAKKIRTGNRAQAGDFGLYIGFPINNYVDDIKYGDLVPFPIVNLKFFALDQLEVRASIDAKAYSQKAMGKLMTTEKKLGEGQSSGHFLVLPGILPKGTSLTSTREQNSQSDGQEQSRGQLMRLPIWRHSWQRTHAPSE